MAIEPAIWRLLSELKPAKLLMLGYGDLLLSHGEPFPIANDAAAVAQWHGWDGMVYDTTAALKTLGCEPVYVDIRASRNAERIVDLNRPLPHDLIGGFDAVLDPGTLEHVANIYQGFVNCIAALKNTGVIVHTNPLSQVNHGFYCICPTMYADFYEHHGFSVELKVLNGPLSKRAVVDAPA